MKKIQMTYKLTKKKEEKTVYFINLHITFDLTFVEQEVTKLF